MGTDSGPQVAIVSPDQDPTAAFTVGAGGLTKTFDGSSSHDPDGTVARDLWNFDDGTPIVSGGPKQTHTYKTPGTYDVTLTVVDNDGCTARIYTGQTASCGGTGRNPAP